MMASWNPLDWFLVLIVAVSTIGAFSRGIIRVLVSLAGLAAGLILASWNYVQLGRWMGQWLPRGELSDMAAFLLILVGVMFLFGLVARIVRSAAEAVGLSLVDRLLGGVFGVLRGCLIGAAFILTAVAFVPRSSWVENSRLTPYFLAEAHALSFVVPEQMQRQIADGAASLLRQAPAFPGSLAPRPRTRN